MRKIRVRLARKPPPTTASPSFFSQSLGTRHSLANSDPNFLETFSNDHSLLCPAGALSEMIAALVALLSSPTTWLVVCGIFLSYLLYQKLFIDIYGDDAKTISYIPFVDWVGLGWEGRKSLGLLNEETHSSPCHGNSLN